MGRVQGMPFQPLLQAERHQETFHVEGQD